jgi:hypothetical protein
MTLRESVVAAIAVLVVYGLVSTAVGYAIGQFFTG